jgi:predicted amidohydrolase YtcJ
MNDLVIKNVTVWAGSRPKPRQGWVAINSGKFSAIGAEEEMPPAAAELEEASSGRKVFLACESLHRGILSERALEALIFSLGEGELKEILRAEANRHLSYGITDVHEPGVTYDMCKHMVALNDQSPLRLSWSEIGSKGPISTAGDGQPLENFGNGPSSAKVFTDGAHRCAVCVDASQAVIMTLGAIVDSVKRLNIYPLRQLLEEEFSFKKGEFYRKGALFKPTELTDKLAQLSESHERIKIHALGNQAVDMACECVVELGITTKVCIEHATVLNDDNIEKLAKHGVQVSGIRFIKVSSRYDYNVSSGLHYGRLTDIAYFLASINIYRLS